MVYLDHLLKARNAALMSGGKIIKGQRRQHVVERIMDTLDDWRSSPWEHEGSTRAGLRAALCQLGNGWNESDHEAAALLGTALKKLGKADRPTWIEGQPEYLLPRENCIRCGDALDEETIESRGRFCSDICRQSAAQFNTGIHQLANRRAYIRTWYVVAKAAAPERPCQMCGKGYRSAFEEQKFCSYSCSCAAQRNPERRRQCAHCQKAFVIRQTAGKTQRHCSRECRLAAWEMTDFRCEVCD
ncbi:hypothetical protein E2F50_00150 [Rhizobium deserti]|uniref:Uncharacterized protein n=1 Tax=Rhizobium deserti TaxID=2547961 RepID=A0A4R5ULB2_9HYPH|nr:hypothetical protein [Rhizobium deserti]TDK38612.1 hypothetical protein E2F50_00150 [Rhizobium deserti]